MSPVWSAGHKTSKSPVWPRRKPESFWSRHYGVSPRATDSEEDAIIEELEKHPLAISQAGAYMFNMGTSASEYLAILAESSGRQAILTEDQFDRYRKSGVPNCILKTWDISIQRLRERNLLAYKLLNVLAHFDNQDIPLEMI